MKAGDDLYKKPDCRKLIQQRCSSSRRALCCSCSCSSRLSVSSSEEADHQTSSSTNSQRYASLSSLAHAMVQERLDQMIRERQQDQEARIRSTSSRRRSISRHGTKFIVMVAMEKRSYDPRQDFRESMVEMVMANRIQQPQDLRSLLNYYMSMNSHEYHQLILEVFHQVCSDLFLSTPVS